MKPKALMTQLLTFSFLLLILLFSCTKEDPAVPATDERDAYIGIYLVEEECDGYTNAYSIQIEK